MLDSLLPRTTCYQTLTSKSGGSYTLLIGALGVPRYVRTKAHIRTELDGMLDPEAGKTCIQFVTGVLIRDTVIDTLMAGADAFCHIYYRDSLSVYLPY